MVDAITLPPLSRNTTGAFATIVANCIAHARRRYVEVAGHFPDECRYVLETLGEDYVLTARAKGLKNWTIVRRHGLRIWGPNQQAARFESSKVFSQQFMEKYGIPTARAGTFTDAPSASRFAASLGGRCAVKADGLAAGKGVVVAASAGEAHEAIDFMLSGDAGVAHNAGRARVVIEEFLEGEVFLVLGEEGGGIAVDDAVVSFAGFEEKFPGEVVFLMADPDVEVGVDPGTGVDAGDFVGGDALEGFGDGDGGEGGILGDEAVEFFEEGAAAVVVVLPGVFAIEDDGDEGIAAFADVGHAFNDRHALLLPQVRQWSAILPVTHPWPIRCLPACLSPR